VTASETTLPPPRAGVLQRAVGFLCRDGDRISARVRARRERMRARGLEGEALRDALVREIVREHCLLGTGLNGVAALPVTLPLAGPWGTLGIAVAGSVLGELAVMVEMIHAIAAAYDSPLEGDELRAAAWRLLRLSSAGEVRETAWNVAVRVTVKKVAEKALTLGATRVVHAWTGVAHRAGMPGDPAVATAVGWMAVPVLAGLSWRDGQAVAARAIEFFATEGSPS